MTRKERIKDLENQIYSKNKEISVLNEQLKSEKVADFYETHNLAEGQHFLYEGKECVGIEYNYGTFKTHRIKKDGGVSLQPTIIYYKDDIKPI